MKISQIKKTYTKFYSYTDQTFRSMVSEQPVRSEVVFPPRSPYQIITPGRELVCMDLIRYGDEIRHVKIVEGPDFTRDELKQFSRHFSLTLKENKYHKDHLVAIIDDGNSNDRYPCYAALKKENDRKFLLIYCTSGTTSFEDDKVYVHGIWEIA